MGLQRSSWQRGPGAHAAGIASEGVPARTGRVPGTGEAAAPRSWCGAAAGRSATAVMCEPGAR